MAIANITNNILTDSGVATSSLLPLSGGTLTGLLNGTSADFSSSITAPELLLDSAGTASATFVKNTNGIGVISSGSNQIGFNLNNAFFITSDNKGCSIFSFNHSSSSYTYTLPSANGTIALTSDLGSYVPYTGATANVTLGAFDLSADDVTLTSNLASLTRDVVNSIGILRLQKGANGYIQPSTLSVDRTYTLPDATGTIALTSNLSAYLPLSGGTLTGALNGTSAVFSSTVQASAYRLTGMTAGSGALYWTSDRVTLANYNATGVVNIEANGGTSVATFGGATYNNDFVGTLRNTTSAYFATTSGNVGIGLTNPTGGKLCVESGGSDTLININNTTTNGSALYLTVYTSGSLVSAGQILQDNTGNMRIYTGTPSPTEKMRITSAGNVGIGTSSPSSILHAYRNNGTDINFTIENGSTAGFSTSIKLVSAVDFGAGYHTISSNTSGGSVHWSIGSAATTNTMAFYTNNNVERMRITSGGQVQIKQAANTHNDGFSLYNTGNQVWNFVNGGDSNLYLGYAGNSRGYFNSSTGVYTPITPSDSILKDNIINYNRGLSELLKLEVKEWEYNGKAGTMAGEKTIGFVADQIVNVIPEWVSEYDVKLEESDEEKTQVKRIITNDLQYLLVKAIQELSAQNQDLKSRLDKLENK